MSKPSTCVTNHRRTGYCCVAKYYYGNIIAPMSSTGSTNLSVIHVIAVPHVLLLRYKWKHSYVLVIKCRITHCPLRDVAVILKVIFWNKISSLAIGCATALRWMPQNVTNEKSLFVQIIAWCRQARSHYLNQCWPSSTSPYSVTKPQWVIKYKSYVSASPMGQGGHISKSLIE